MPETVAAAFAYVGQFAATVGSVISIAKVAPIHGHAIDGVAQQRDACEAQVVSEAPEQPE